MQTDSLSRCGHCNQVYDKTTLRVIPVKNLQGSEHLNMPTPKDVKDSLVKTAKVAVATTLMAFQLIKGKFTAFIDSVKSDLTTQKSIFEDLQSDISIPAEQRALVGTIVSDLAIVPNDFKDFVEFGKRIIDQANDVDTIIKTKSAEFDAKVGQLDRTIGIFDECAIAFAGAIKRIVKEQELLRDAMQQGPNLDAVNNSIAQMNEIDTQVQTQTNVIRGIVADTKRAVDSASNADSLLQ